MTTARLPTCQVTWPEPLDLPASLEGFRRWGDDGLERWDGRVLVRTARLAGESVPFACTVLGTVEAPAVRVQVAAARHLPAVARLVQEMVVRTPSALAALVARDAVIARLARHYRGVRPVLQSDPFAALVRAITAQQVNLRWAHTVRRRLAEAFGTRHRLGPFYVYSLEPERLARADPAALRALQLTQRKAEAIIALAQAVASGALDLDALRQRSDAEVVACLTAQRGLGRWSAEWFLARTLGRPCVVAGDLGVRKAVGLAYLGGRVPSEAEVRTLTAHWGEAAGVAQQLLLHALLHGWPAAS
ncbi:MAG: hypothetical protein KatS3mg131_1772 [Candidatus Tectimicrobiota bacterium]|nr:MAG: hypothetical protein KatS3mg131_1772 [Candidatus Tectomicrobia bacterium]